MMKELSDDNDQRSVIIRYLLMCNFYIGICLHWYKHELLPRDYMLKKRKNFSNIYYKHAIFLNIIFTLEFFCFYIISKCNGRIWKQLIEQYISHFNCSKWFLHPFALSHRLFFYEAHAFALSLSLAFARRRIIHDKRKGDRSGTRYQKEK